MANGSDKPFVGRSRGAFDPTMLCFLRDMVTKRAGEGKLAQDNYGRDCRRERGIGIDERSGKTGVPVAVLRA